jgi:3',5'-cyclic AMP phosphodiesterase CpdA
MRLLAACVLGAGLLALTSGCGRGNTQESVSATEAERTMGAEDTDASETVKSETTETSASETIAPFPLTEAAESEAGETDIPEGKDKKGTGWDHQIFLATDIHYFSRELTDGGEYFQYFVEHGDGKVVTYVEQITDAFIETVIRKRPDVLILSGDLTLDGEKKSHEELAEKLYEVKKAGIPVLVIPGNHDINNRHAAAYFGNERKPAEYTTPEEFRNIYRDFGYDEAVAEDPSSLSYVYDLDPSTRFLMIDSCMYEPRARVGGAISDETYSWIEKQLEDAWDNGMNVIPVAHHNLLDESEIEEYVTDCTIEHGEQLARLLDDWDVSLFLSGHLHVQHAKRSEEDHGVWEVVTSSMSTPACQYGVVDVNGNGAFSYHTAIVDVQDWAKRHKRQEEDLLEFDTFKEPFLRQVFCNQAYDALEKVDDLTEDQKTQMAELYSKLKYHYYQGDTYLVRDEIEDDPAFGWWQENGTVICDYLNYILRDGEVDYSHIKAE